MLLLSEFIREWLSRAIARINPDGSDVLAFGINEIQDLRLTVGGEYLRVWEVTSEEVIDEYTRCVEEVESPLLLMKECMGLALADAEVKARSIDLRGGDVTDVACGLVDELFNLGRGMFVFPPISRVFDIRVKENGHRRPVTSHEIITMLGRCRKNPDHMDQVTWVFSAYTLEGVKLLAWMKLDGGVV